MRASELPFWTCLVPLALITALAWWRFGPGHREEEFSLGPETFDVSEAVNEPVVRAPYESRFERERRSRWANSIRPIDVAGREPDANAPVPADRRRELEYLRAYAPLVRQEQRRMEAIIRKSRRRFPVIDEFSDDYYRRTRLVDLYRKYREDRDFYSYVRAAAALPESKELIDKYVARLDAWKAGLAMTAEALRDPPPQVVYSEVLKVLTSDRLAAKDTNVLLAPILERLPLMTVQAAVPTSDMRRIEVLARDASKAPAH